MRNRDRWKPSKYVYSKGKLIASRDVNEVNLGSRLMADAIARFYGQGLREHAKGKLLDLGCGKVPLFEAYREFVDENICVDWEKGQHMNEYLDCECDLNAQLPFTDSEFETIILSDTLEHIAEPDGLWTEMARVLSPGGKIIVSVPFYYWLHEQPHDYYRYTEFALRRFVTRSGLRVIQLESLGGTPEVMADILSKNIFHLPLIGPSLAALTQWFTSGFVRTSLGKKLSDATRAIFPFGYFLVAGKQHDRLIPEEVKAVRHIKRTATDI